MSGDSELNAFVWAIFGLVAMFLIGLKTSQVHLRLACAAGAGASIGFLVYKSKPLLGLAVFLGIFVSVLFFAALTFTTRGGQTDRNIFKDD